MGPQVVGKRLLTGSAALVFSISAPLAPLPRAPATFPHGGLPALAAALYSRRLNGASHEAPAFWWHHLVLRVRKRRGKLQCGELLHISERVRAAAVLEAPFFSLFVCLVSRSKTEKHFFFFFLGRQHRVCVVCVCVCCCHGYSLLTAVA